MSAIIIDGKAISAEIKNEVKQKVAWLKEVKGKTITLAVILIGNDPASEVYVNNKIKACEYVGIVSQSYRLPENTTQEQAEELVKNLASDNGIDGILVQLPLPKHLSEESLLKYIPADKDVDGLLDENIGKLFQNKKTLVSCTPNGIMQLLSRYNVDLNGKNAVVIGRSNMVGKPMAALLINANATVTVCHSRTKNLTDFTKNADVLIVAIGKKHFVTADMVKPGAVVIDVGINRIDGKLYGDVDFDGVKEVASQITPVPGGVGPMTIAMLMYNTYLTAENKVD